MDKEYVKDYSFNEKTTGLKAAQQKQIGVGDIYSLLANRTKKADTDASFYRWIATAIEFNPPDLAVAERIYCWLNTPY